MRIIGIDPGTAIVGYGIIDFNKNTYTIVDYGVIITEKNLKMEERLQIIYNELENLLDKFKPEYMAIEDLFYFKNNKTVISVAQARGVILLAGKKRNISISNYTPLQVKMGITGYGKAEKKQVQEMVKRILKLDKIPKPDDAADALAIAVTHINSLTTNIGVSLKINTSIKEKISLEEYKKLLKK